MAWIKRNLLFVVGAVIAVGLLAAAGVYDFKNWQRNNAALDALNQAYVTLQSLYSQNPSPGNDKIDNTKAAGEQEKQLRQWIQGTEKYFQPIPSIPDSAKGEITDARFAGARDHTLSQLQAGAASASVTVPPQYGFSFEAERTLVKFSPGSLDALAQQLGEVKAVCEILYAARVNSLDGVRRVRVSNDDTGGPQSDYLDQTITTNDLAIFTPYQVTFRCFSQDLARVLSSFESSPHGFIVKDINVQPAAGVTAASATSNPGAEAGGFGQPLFTPSPARLPVAPMGRGGLQTVLDEQLLSITLDVEIVKLLPGD
jgi:type II secretory pathway pseudopilin PulG